MAMNDMTGSMPMVGDRIKVVIPPHMPGHEVGVVRQVVNGALGIEFDAMPGEVHHWYVPSEVMVVSDSDAGGGATGGKKKKKEHDMPGMSVATLALDGAEAPIRSVSSYKQKLRAWLASNERRFDAAANGEELELSMLDVIGEDWWTGGGITAKSVKAQLDAHPNAKAIRVLINSPGGDVFEGMAIRSLLKRHPARVEVEVVGLAASAASVIAMAGDSIQMHEGSMLMIHEAWCGCMGQADDMRQTATVLDKINSALLDVYVSRTGRNRDEVQALVAAETWMTASEAVESKFADGVITASPSENKKSGKAKAHASGAPAARPGHTGAMAQAEHTITVKLDVDDATREVIELTDEDIRAVGEDRERRSREREEHLKSKPVARFAGAPPPPLAAKVHR